MLFSYLKRGLRLVAHVFYTLFIINFTSLAFTSLSLTAHAEEHMAEERMGEESMREMRPREMRYGIMAHDIEDRDEKGANINVTWLYESRDWLAKLKSPRPLIGLSVNTSGDTSQLYTGLAWQIPISQQFYGEIMLGLTLHNGETTKNPPKDKRALGCAVLFREEAS
ncbi:MAG: hypothetical protein OXT03_06610, partial [Alphaproteobacteria bacterium]|nr:hypothetical protein [Alphaproteobacteria bacterium]